jgi:adenosylcobinamide-phosphate synthase
MVKLVLTATSYCLDLKVGELTNSKWHPIRLLGHLLHIVEKTVYKKSKLAGFFYVSISISTVILLYRSIKVISKSKLHPANLILSAFIYFFIVNQALASNALYKEALNIKENLLVNDIKSARHNLKALVGRNVDDLKEDGIVKAVIESVAENTTDTVISPLFYGSLFSDLAVLVFKTVNTMDSMVGHKNEAYSEFGYFAAKMDDLANFIPARISFVLLIILSPKKLVNAIKDYRLGGKLHPSPNAGLIESGFATILNVTLGGDVMYGSEVDHRPVLNGNARQPKIDDISLAIALSKKIAIAFLISVSGTRFAFLMLKRSKSSRG